MTDTDIVTAFRQWTEAIAKHAKIGDEARRVDAEHTKLRQQEKDAWDYVVRCQNQVAELAKRVAKAPVVVPPTAVVVEESPRKPVLPVLPTGVFTSPAKPAKVRAL